MNALADVEVLQRAQRQSQVVATLQPLLRGELLWHAEETTQYECHRRIYEILTTDT